MRQAQFVVLLFAPNDTRDHAVTKELKKIAECIVELYKQAGSFKNTREVRRSTNRRRVLLVLLECS